MAILTPELRVPETSPTARSAGILGLGAHLPAGVLTNADLEARVDTSDQWIMERTGIRHRHQAGAGETASTMGAQAARAALDAAGNPRIDAIIAATCSPDTLFPSTACLIQRALELPGIPAFDVDAACSVFIYGVTVAEGLIAAGTAERVLVVGTEAMTSLVDFGDRTTCVLFGDGAGAAVIGRVEGGGGIKARRIGADGGDAALIYYGPPAGGDGTEEDRLRMAGKGTYRLAVDKLCGLTEQVCLDAGWDLADVDLFVPHQANLRIIEAAAKRIGVPMEKVMVNVEETGNTSAATIPLALSDAVAQGRVKPGDKVVLVAFGAGATWGGIALEWT